MNILGRPYVLFDPEQTTYIKQLERKQELKESIINSLSQLIESVDDYGNEFTVDEELHKIVSEGLAQIQYLAGMDF